MIGGILTHQSDYKNKRDDIAIQVEAFVQILDDTNAVIDIHQVTIVIPPQEAIMVTDTFILPGPGRIDVQWFALDPDGFALAEAKTRSFIA